MRHALTSVLVAIGTAVLIFTRTMSLSHPISAAERSATKATASATPAASDGALFVEFVSVLRHPRCMNCHSRGDFPRQGDDGHPHTMNVRRGPQGHGVTAEKCSTCHQDHNLAGAHMPPGAPNWGLPPPATPMIWQGLTDAQLCRSIKDPKQNKNRNLDQLVEHLTQDKLVMWGWNPGEGRNPIPMSQEEFAAKVKQWQAAGAPCPADTGKKSATITTPGECNMASANNKQTEKTLLHHWQAFEAGDVETIMSDYATDAALITPDGPLKGHAQIRSMFEKIFANMFPPNSISLNLAKQIVEGEMAYILWSGSSALYNATFATDTFVMRDGKIVAQTFAAQLEKK